MATKNAIMKALVEGVIVELMVKSSVENIFLPDGSTTLAAKLSEIVTSINDINTELDDIPTSSTVDEKISAAINGLIDGAPATYDTLKEIADYLATHQDEYTALVTEISKKVDKVEGKGLSTNDFTTALKEKLDAIAEGANNYVLPAATASVIGGVKPGANLSVEADGTLNAVDTTYSAATASEDGLMSAADKAKLNGIAANANNYTLPKATASTLGGVKVGSGISVADDGTISVPQGSKIYVSSSQPAGLKADDLWIQV